MDRRTPIERMIDDACGVGAPGSPRPLSRRTITLRCPKCLREKLTRRYVIDPAEAEVLVCPCNLCQGDEFPPVTYLDANGKELPL